MTEEKHTLVPTETLEKNLEAERQHNLRALKKSIEQFLQLELKTVATFLRLILLVTPWLLSSPEEFDNTLCSLRDVILEDARNTVITCTNPLGEEVEITLEFLIYNFDVGTLSEEKFNNPPFFTSEYANTIENLNFNCHSLTLQIIQRATGVEFGADQTTWLEKGFDAFIAEFSEEITRVDEIPLNSSEDVIDTTNVLPGDVVLFFDNTGALLHSATVLEQVTSPDGETYLLIANKLGRDGELNSSIGDMADLYELNGPYDEAFDLGGGAIIVYRPDLERIQNSFPRP